MSAVSITSNYQCIVLRCCMMTSYQHWRSYAKRRGSTWSGKLQMQSLATSSASAQPTDTKKLSGTASTALACSTHLDDSFGQAKNACVCLFEVFHVLQAIEKLAASAFLCFEYAAVRRTGVWQSVQLACQYWRQKHAHSQRSADFT